MKKNAISLKNAASWAVLAAIFLSGFGAARAADAPRDEPKPAWRTGPVRYILTPEEDKAYKGLKTDEDRAKAIEAFWLRRDPTPGTPANEFRDDFYRRLDDTAKEFREGTVPGWMTDRGKLLLTAGYPDERATDTNKETWTYKRAFPGADGQPGPAKTWKVQFIKEEGAEEFRMSTEGRELLDAAGLSRSDDRGGHLDAPDQDREAGRPGRSGSRRARRGRSRSPRGRGSGRRSRRTARAAGRRRTAPDRGARAPSRRPSSGCPRCPATSRPRMGPRAR